MDRFEAGGNAFPDDDHYGMTVLDYFAAKAMQALISNNNDTAFGDGYKIAKQAYILANAMIEERGEQ